MDVFSAEDRGLRDEHPSLARIARGDLARGEARVQLHGRARAVVAREQPGRDLGDCSGWGATTRWSEHGDAEGLFELCAGDCAGAKDAGARGLAEVNDGGFETDRAGAAVEDVADFIAEAVAHVLGGGGAHVAERVRTRGGERQAREPEEATEEGMSGHADGDTRETGGHDRGHERGLRQHEGERAGPECLREHEGGGVDDCELGEVRDRFDVHD